MLDKSKTPELVITIPYNCDLMDAIHAALKKGVKIDVLSTASSFNTDYWQKFNRDATGNLRLFRPSANIIDEQKLGSHAKFCVMDGKSAYVGSANLTGPGLSSQLELGLLVHGDIAIQIQYFWDYSIEIGLFILV
jgi:phosphatidylserine/phosphatidylglycerophosphate/cardiolipin synthase-like enzyme